MVDLSQLVQKSFDSAPQPFQSVGIMVSGGLDSSVLLYHLVKLVGPELMLFTVDKTDCALVHATNIANIISDMTEVPIRKPRTIGNAGEHHSLQVFSGVEEIYRKGLVDIVFLGDNALPTDRFLHEHEYAPTRMRSFDPRVIQPFFELTKDKIIQSALASGLELIVEHSHTCTESSSGRCNQCWQCQERAWAFNEISQVDLGQL